MASESSVSRCRYCAQPCRWVVARKHNGEESPMLIGLTPNRDGRAVHYNDRWWIRHPGQLDRQDARDAAMNAPPRPRYLVHGKWTCGRQQGEAS